MDDFLTEVSNGVLDVRVELVLALLTSLFIGSALVLLWYKRKPEDKVLLVILAVLQIIEFVTINIWYWAMDYLLYPLPLYHCRIAKILLVLFVFLPSKWRRKARGVYIYTIGMAVLGAIASFVYPSSDAFLWPHITHVCYFFGHFNLMLFSIAMLMVEKERWTLSDFWKGQGVVLIFNILITIVARASHANYSYFLESPLFNEPLQANGPIVYTLILMFSYAVLFALAFLVIKGIERIAWGKK